MIDEVRCSEFYGENENAIRTQVWSTLIAQLLINVLQKKQWQRKHFQQYLRWFAFI